MATTPAAPAPQAGGARTLYLSGQPLGRLSDVIVALRGAELPVVSGLVATVGGREVYVPIAQAGALEGEVLPGRAVALIIVKIIQLAAGH